MGRKVADRNLQRHVQDCPAGTRINLSVLNPKSKGAELSSTGGNSHTRDLFWPLAGGTRDGGDPAPWRGHFC